MPPYAVIDKREGETPLQAIEQFRRSEGYGGISLTYAGRLDPMASGKLLVLIGDECRKKDAYLRLDKQYDFEILFGYSSDTGDILGFAERCGEAGGVRKDALQDVVRRLQGDVTLPYPAFSSKSVGGKPLFARARENTLPDAMPEKSVRIHTLQCIEVRTTTGGGLLENIERRLSSLKPDEASTNPYKDFRKPDVIARWREILAPAGTFQIARCRAIVSSGTYIRSLAPRIAREVGSCGLAYSIRRTEIGRYVRMGRLAFWLRSY